MGKDKRRGLKPVHKYTSKAGKVISKSNRNKVYDKYTKDDTARIIQKQIGTTTYYIEVLLPNDPLLRTQKFGENIDDLIDVESNVVGLIIAIDL